MVPMSMSLSYEKSAIQSEYFAFNQYRVMLNGLWVNIFVENIKVSE